MHHPTVNLLNNYLKFSLFIFVIGCSSSQDSVSPTYQLEFNDVDQSLIISKESFETNDPYEIIDSNFSIINTLFDEHFRHDELSQDALRSYYVEYYLFQMDDGGFSQFVYNSNWEERTIRYVREGLKAMGAHQHYELFNQSAEILDRLGPDGIEKYLDSGYFGENEEREILNQFNEKFYKFIGKEDLTELNANWLKGHPKLVIMSKDEFKEEIARRVSALPDHKERTENEIVLILLLVR